MKVFDEFVGSVFFVDLKLSQNPYMPTTLKCFPIRFSRERISPSLEGAWDGLWVDFQLLCRCSNGRKFLFFIFQIPQKNCGAHFSQLRQNCFLPQFQFHDFDFAFGRVDKPRRFFLENSRNVRFRNAEKNGHIAFCVKGLFPHSKFCFPFCDDSFAVKMEKTVARLDFSIHELLRNAKHSRHCGLSLERPCNNLS